MIEPYGHPWLERFEQGYGPFILVVAAILAVAVVLPTAQAIDSAPSHVTEADLARLRSLPPALGSVESGHPAFRWRGGRSRGMSPCTRDNALLDAARFLHLPRSWRLRFEYSLITDCRLRRG